jgi:broad specificity phosphatase PhoE
MTQTRRYHHRFWLVTFGLLWSMVAAVPVLGDTHDRFTGTVIFMRHALAPGTGDPSNFVIDDCRTQRNLDDTGRKQARAIGAKLAAANIQVSALYSSYWCRCLETAQLLDLGPVTPFDGLNSFYENHAPRAATLARLTEKLATLPQTAGPVIMVTHYVTIQAITGLSVRSGGVVVYDLKTGSARELAFSSLQ